MPPLFQFEDPAPGLQLLREKLELEMMDACDWLTAPATQALAAAAAIEKKLQDVARQLWASKGNKQQQAPGQNAAEGPAVAAAPPAAAAAGGGVGSSSNGVEQQVVMPESPASKLVMPLGLQQRVTKELKIHKHQVRNGSNSLCKQIQAYYAHRHAALLLFRV